MYHSVDGPFHEIASQLREWEHAGRGEEITPEGVLLLLVLKKEVSLSSMKKQLLIAV